MSWLLFSFLVHSAYAFTISGTVVRTQDELYIKADECGGPNSLAAGTDGLQAILHDLSTGDYLNGEVVGGTQTDLELTALNYVGFSKLLGHWQAPTGERIEFNSFEALTFSNLNSPTKRHYLYRIAPKDNSTWGFFMMSSTESWIGTLSIGRLFILVDLFEVTSGRTLKLQLAPYRWPISAENAI